MRPQCPRCWGTWDSWDAYQDHIRSEIRCSDRSHHIDDMESISSDVFEKVKKILSTARPKKNKSTEGAAVPALNAREKWYDVKREIFHPTKYPHFPDPKHPCKFLLSPFLHSTILRSLICWTVYQDPDGKLNKPGDERLEKARELTRAIWKAKAEEARRADLVSQTSEYRPHREECEDLVVKVVEMLDRTASCAGPRATPSSEGGTEPQEKSHQIAQQVARATSGIYEHKPWSEQELADIDFEQLLNLPPVEE